jgi:hypothetical protein
VPVDDLEGFHWAGVIMKTGLQMSAAALALAGAALFASTPASADSFGLRYGPGFSYESGGYCDSLGCPDEFWDYPVAYCPVYFAGEWYRGPFYYRTWQGDYFYWIRGDWRRDEWSGDRPDDACVGRYGPPLDYDFYISNGFIWRDEWRFLWFRRHHHGHDHDGDHDHHGGHDHGSWDHGGDHGRVWDHSGDHNLDGGGDRGGAATGMPAPLGGHPHESGFGRGGNGGGSTIVGAPGTNGGGPRDHFNGEGDRQPHERDAPAPSNSPGGGDSSGHHGAPPPPSSPAPSPPPPNSPPPSSGESHHDSGSRGDFSGHHTHAP